MLPYRVRDDGVVSSIAVCVFLPPASLVSILPTLPRPVPIRDTTLIQYFIMSIGSLYGLQELRGGMPPVCGLSTILHNHDATCWMEFRCEECGRPPRRFICKSNTNGNAGKVFIEVRSPLFSAGALLTLV